jgi:hypothetical protein
MNNAKSLYHAHHFPGAVISCAVRWYFRFQLSLCDIEEIAITHSGRQSSPAEGHVREPVAMPFAVASQTAC